MTPRIMILSAISVTILVITVMFYSGDRADKEIVDLKSIPKKLGANSAWIASVQYHSKGCFHNVEETISLYSKETEFVVQYIYKKVSRIIEISHSQKDAFLNFVGQLEVLKNDFISCTTVDTYHVELNGRDFNKTDGSCGWDGYYAIKDTLKLKGVINYF